MDTFSKFEKYLYQILFYAALFGVPFLATHFSSIFVPDGESTIFKYAYIGIATVIGYALSYVILRLIENSSNTVRTFLGLKTLVEVDDGYKDELSVREERKEEREHQYFKSLSPHEQSYSNWKILKYQGEVIRKMKSDIEFMKFVIIIFVVFEIASRYGF